MCKFEDGHGHTITYKAVRKAMKGEPFTMNLTGRQEIRAIMEVVNQGIDAHLEACFVPDRGDRYDGGARMIGEQPVSRSLDCSISEESLPVLLRRLSELGSEDTNLQNAAESLVNDILLVLGFDECGKLSVTGGHP